VQETAKAGEDVVFTINPTDTAYVFSIDIYGGEAYETMVGERLTYAFEMPSTDVTIYVEQLEIIDSVTLVTNIEDSCEISYCGVYSYPVRKAFVFDIIVKDGYTVDDVIAEISYQGSTYTCSLYSFNKFSYQDVFTYSFFLGNLGDLTITATLERLYDIIVESAENGSVSVLSKSTEGSTVSIILKPDDGYVVSSVSVVDSNGNTVTVEPTTIHL